MCAGIKNLRLICRFIESLPAQNVRAHYHEDLDAEVDYYDEEAVIDDVFAALATNEFFLEEIFGKLTNGDFHWRISGKTLCVRYISTFTGGAIFKLSNIVNGVLALAEMSSVALGYTICKYDTGREIKNRSPFYEFDVDENLSVEDVVKKITTDAPVESTLYWNMVIKRGEQDEPPKLALTFVWDKPAGSLPLPSLGSSTKQQVQQKTSTGNKRVRPDPAAASPAPVPVSVLTLPTPVAAAAVPKKAKEMSI